MPSSLCVALSVLGATPIHRKRMLFLTNHIPLTHKMLSLLSRVFTRAHYESDATRFIDALKLQRPQLANEQRAGRALLWDNASAPVDAAGFAAAKVPQQPYVYQTKG